MRSNPIYLAGCFSLFLLISACAKQTKDDRANPAEPPSTTNARLAAASPDGELLHQFLQKNGPAFEAYTIDGSDGGVFVSKSRNVYTIRPNSLVHADGSAPSGPVTIFLKEISTPANMIFADRQTATSSGEPMVSYGEFFLRAQEAGKDLQLRPDSGVIVQAPARQVAERIPMWNGDTTVTASLSGYNYQNQFTTVSTEVSANKGVDWDPVTNPGSAYAFFDGSSGTLNFRLDSLIKWVNCDLLMSNPNPKTTVLVYFSNNYNPETDASYMGEEPTMLFFKPSGVNSVIKFYNTIFKAPAGFEGFLSYQNSIPIGQKGTFLAISSINGVFYADQQDVTIAAPATGLNYTTVTLNPQPVSAAALVSLINIMNTK